MADPISLSILGICNLLDQRHHLPLRRLVLDPGIRLEHANGGFVGHVDQA